MITPKEEFTQDKDICVAHVRPSANKKDDMASKMRTIPPLDV